MSTDATLKIILEEYPSVEIMPWASNNELRDDLYLSIKNNCWKKSDAHYVIVCDMDELLQLPPGFLEQNPATLHTNTLPMVIGYNMISDGFTNDYSRPITDQIRTGVRAFHFDKQIIFSPQQISEIDYTPGAHQCMPAGHCTTSKKYELKLLHYKYLGKNYVRYRYNMYAHRLSEYNKQYNFGAEYLKSDEYIQSILNLAKHKLETVI